MSCLLPVPPPCSTSPPLSPSPSPPPPFPPHVSAAHTYGHTATQVHTLSHTSPHGSLAGLGMDFFLSNVVWSAAPVATMSKGGLQLCHSLTQTTNTQTHTHSIQGAPLRLSLFTDLSVYPFCLSPSPILPLTHSTPSLSLSRRPTFTFLPSSLPAFLPSHSFFHDSSHKQASWIPAGAPRSVHRDCSAIRHICSVIRKAKGAWWWGQEGGVGRAPTIAAATPPPLTQQQQKKKKTEGWGS